MSKSPSLRRIQADIRELALDPSDRYQAAPLENDMFEWHFTIRGADDTDFEGGIYHGRILLPPEYPFKPPHIVMLTPTGRFETNKKVCLSFSAFHPELWQPAWGIRLILEALISFLPTPADGAIGALDWSSDERKRLAKKSVNFECPMCGRIKDLLPEIKEGEKPKKAGKFQKEIAELQRLQEMSHAKNEEVETSKTDDKEKEETTTSSLPMEEGSDKKIQAISENQTISEDNKPPAAAATPKSEDVASTDNSVDIDSTGAVGPCMFNTEGMKGCKATNENDDDDIPSSVAVGAATPKRLQSDLNDDLFEEEITTDVPTTGNKEEEEKATKPAVAVEQELRQRRPQQAAAAVPAAVEPPQPENNAPVAGEQLQQPQQQYSNALSLLDPILQVIIILLSIICYLLIRKIQALIADIRALEH